MFFQPFSAIDPRALTVGMARVYIIRDKKRPRWPDGTPLFA
jgi:hypothetical protein